MNNPKPLCVFVHGWGMNNAVWQPVIEALPDNITSIAINLPGHGNAAQRRYDSLSDLAIALKNEIAQPAIWIGWSLGGLATLQLAHDFPDRVQALMLVASTPCFIRRDNWPHGMQAEVFDGFARELESDFIGTIKRFLTLQVKNSEHGRQLLKQLRQQVLQQPAADSQALRSGLAILKTTDLRSALSALKIPLAVALGEQDGLVSANNAAFFASQKNNADIQLYAQAAHAPFLSHLPQFTAQLIRLVTSVHEPSF